MELAVDKDRAEFKDATGIYVRAKRGDKWDSVDIAELTAGSLLIWLRSREGDNQFAEDVVGILLGHGHLHIRASTSCRVCGGCGLYEKEKCFRCDGKGYVWVP